MGVEDVRLDVAQSISHRDACLEIAREWDRRARVWRERDDLDPVQTGRCFGGRCKARFRLSFGNYEQMDLSFDGESLGRDPQREERWRISPNLTWYPSEFSKVRLQYNYDDRSQEGVDHSVWLQFEFLLGAHAAHRF